MSRHGTSRFIPYNSDLDVGDPVYMKSVDGKSWKPALVERPDSSPFSYHVKLSDGSILRRTRSDLKPRPTPSYLELQEQQREWNQFSVPKDPPVSLDKQYRDPVPRDPPRDPQISTPYKVPSHTPEGPSMDGNPVTPVPRRSVRIGRGVPPKRLGIE